MAGQRRIASSGPVEARSKIAAERVIRKRARASLGTLAKEGYQRFLGSLIQPLFHHVDDQDGWPIGPKAPDLIYHTHELANFPLQCRLVHSQGKLHTLRVTFQHSRHMAEAKAERTKGHDLGRSNHLVGTIESVSGRGAVGIHQASLLIQSQGFGRDTEPLGCFGSAQASSGRTHESPLCLLTVIVMTVAPRG